MFKVLLADDEKVICEGLKVLIDWRKFGLEICAVARNGLEVLELDEIHNPDLIITDIRMPKMDGLSAMAELKRRKRDVQVLLLTGYAEFEYAHKALEQGACGYLVKPVDDAELENQLKRIVDKMFCDRELKIRQERNYLLGLCGRQIETHGYGEFSGIAEEYSYTLISAEYVISARECETVSSLEELEILLTEFRTESKSDELYNNLISMTNECWTNKSWVVPYERGYMVFISGTVADLKNKLNKFTAGREDIRLLIGKTAEHLSELSQSFDTLDSCAQRYFYDKHDNYVIFYRETSENIAVKYESLDIESIVSNLAVFMPDKSIDKLNDIGVRMQSKQFALPIIKAYVNLLITHLALFMDENSHTGHELYKLGEKIKSAVPFMRLDYLLSLMRTMLRLSYNIAVEHSNIADMGIIRDVISYMNERYQSKISLKTAADEFFLNSAYLGQLFKRKMGISFHEYLTGIRMDKAKQLLLTTNRNISEISLAVGIEDPNYFSVKFSKTEGVTPREYRLKAKNISKIKNSN